MPFLRIGVCIYTCFLSFFTENKLFLENKKIYTFNFSSTATNQDLHMLK